MLNKWIKAILSVVVATGLIAFLGHNYINYVEKKQQVVSITKTIKKTLFFYRDDCSDCQSIFHHVYWKNVFNDNVQFINMNQSKNRKYISEYDLTSVPTFIKESERYSGTDVKKIDEIMGD